jgi:tripartite-type tricarboxylate transporter receptor subunit TctC
MLRRTFSLLSIGLFPMVQAFGQDSYPKSAVKIIVPFPPGGPTDVLARQIATRLQERWGQPVLLDFKPGAGTVIGVDAVAKAAPDGLTLGMVNTAVAINPSLKKKLPYDTTKDIRGVTQFASLELAMVARNDAPFNTVQELLAYAKLNPGKVTYATAGAGSTPHLGVELLKREANMDILHVAMKGSAPAYTELMAGRIDILIDPLFAVLPYVQGKKMKLIATLGESRVRGHQGFATVGEAVAGFSVGAMLGLIAPANTPQHIVDRIQKDIAAILSDSAVRSRLEEQGMTVLGTTPLQFNGFIAAELKKWQRVISEARIEAE